MTATLTPVVVHPHLAQALLDRQASVDRLDTDVRRRRETAFTDRDVSDLLDQENPRPWIDDVETEVTLALAREADRRRQDIDDAVRRISEGVYGHCERCDEPVGTVRLLAMPEARLCVSCQREHDRAMRRLTR